MIKVLQLIASQTKITVKSHSTHSPLAYSVLIMRVPQSETLQ